MSSNREFPSAAEDGLRKPLLHKGSWYRMGSRKSIIMNSSAQFIRDGAISVIFCVHVVTLGPNQFGFTCGYSSPTQSEIISDLGLSISEVPVYITEIAPQNMRGSLGSVNQLAVTIGIMLAYLLWLFLN